MSDKTHLLISYDGELPKEKMELLLAQIRVALDMLGIQDAEAETVGREIFVKTPGRARLRGVATTLRNALKEDSRSIRRMSKEMGVPYRTLQGFISERANISTKYLDKIARNMGLWLGRIPPDLDVEIEHEAA